MQQSSVISRIPPGVLKPGELAIDAGANVGDVAHQMRSMGAEVHAFEPNAVAFAVLEKRFARDPLVHCHQAAVGVRDGVGALYMHVDADQDPLKYSTGSSMCADKVNVRPDAAVQVRVVDLARFILALERPVALLKLDVEGLEAAIIERLLEACALERVRLTLAESHERKTPSVRAPLARVREMLQRRPPHPQGWGEVRFDWI